MVLDMLNLVRIIRESSRIILDIYEANDYIVEQKSDSSPVTLADKKANDFLITHLRELYPQGNFITEESSIADYSVRRRWEYTWIIDPLDGTKEFINRNGEFTINIALARYGEIIFGMIMIPVSGIIYYAEKGKGAYKIQDDVIIPIQSLDPESTSLTVLTSRSHRSGRVETFIKERYPQFQNIDYKSAGSSLKICLVADGQAHIYPRLGSTMEWDIAAGVIIAQEAGAIVETIDGELLKFNKEDLCNPSFVVQSF